MICLEYRSCQKRIWQYTYASMSSINYESIYHAIFPLSLRIILDQKITRQMRPNMMCLDECYKARHFSPFLVARLSWHDFLNRYLSYSKASTSLQMLSIKKIRYLCYNFTAYSFVIVLKPEVRELIRHLPISLHSICHYSQFQLSLLCLIHKQSSDPSKLVMIIRNFIDNGMGKPSILRFVLLYGINVYICYK